MRAQRRHADGKPIDAVEREELDKRREQRLQRWMVALMAPCALLLLLTIGSNPIPRTTHNDNARKNAEAARELAEGMMQSR